MRLAVDARTLARPTTGVGSGLASLLSHLKPLMPADEIVLFHDSPSGLPGLRNLQLQDVYLRSPFSRRITGHNVGAMLWLNWTLPRALRSWQIDTILCPNFFVPALKRVRKVIIVHDLAPLRLPAAHYPRAWLAYFRMMLPGSLERADAILTPSQHVRDAIIHRFGTDPAKVIATPQGVAREFFLAPPSALLDSVAQKYGIEQPSVLSVGQNNHRKNLLVLVRALALLRQRDFPSLKLVVCGPRGAASRHLDREIERLGLASAVIRTGPVCAPELSCLYRLATLFAMPSLDEGFGLPVLEAMASGTPVLASDRGALPEVVGDAALVLDPEDVEGWADALSRLLSDEPLSRLLRDRGIARAQEFPWERTAAQTLPVLQGELAADPVEWRRAA